MKRALLLIGSPRQARSTSAVLGSYLLDRLEERGWSAETVHLYRLFRSQEVATLCAAIEAADLVLLSAPLYVDGPPAVVTWAMEQLARCFGGAGPSRRFVVLSNCGFPEAEHNRVALGIYRRFAEAVGWEWAGGLALGGGGAIAGRPLDELGGMVRHVVAGLERVAEDLTAGQAVSQEAVDLLARPIVPARVYTWMGDLGWRRQARKYGTAGRLKERPYASVTH